MTWQLLVILSTLFLASSMLIMRVIGRDPANNGASFVINGGSFIFLWLTGLALVPALGPVDSSVLSTYFWRLLGGGILFALTNVATYKSLTFLDASTGTIFNTLNAVFGVGMAALLLNEDLSLWQAYGAVLLLGAIIYCTLALRSGTTKISRHNIILGLAYALVAAVLYGLAITNEKWLLGSINTATYVVYGWGWQALASVAAALVLQPKKVSMAFGKKLALWLVVLGVVKGLAGICFVRAEILSNNVALVSVTTNFKLVIVVLLGAWLLKERHKLRQKYIGAVVAMVGLTIMFW